MSPCDRSFDLGPSVTGECGRWAEFNVVCCVLWQGNVVWSEKHEGRLGMCRRLTGWQCKHPHAALVSRSLGDRRHSKRKYKWDTAKC